MSHDKPMLGEAGFKPTCPDCHMPLYGGGHHICAKYIRCPHCHYIMKTGDKEHIHFYNIAEQAHVKEDRQRTADDPLKIQYLSAIGLEVRRVDHFNPPFMHSAWPVDAAIRAICSPKPPLTLWQITYRILAQIPLPGQPLYSNSYNLPI